MKVLKPLIDYNNPAALALRLRQRRFAFFRGLLDALPRPLAILDLGGTESYWLSMGFGGEPGLRVVLLNRRPVKVTLPGFSALLGDARNLEGIPDLQFDVVFSNSVIEHVGDASDQARMAVEIRRVGKRYLVQTPNFWFPIEPHFLFPGFQFLPLSLRAWLMHNMPLGNYPRVADRARARNRVASVRLLDERRLRMLFPEARIYRERFLMFTKSLIAYAGWPEEASPAAGTARVASRKCFSRLF
jgi:hypothetical protein